MPKLFKKHKRTLLRLAVILIAGLIVVGITYFLSTRHFQVLDPKGTIAHQQRNLLLFATILSLMVIVPVYVLLFHILRTYRVGAKKKARYHPDWDGSRKLELLWWGIPGIIILILSVVTWQTSHSLDPFRPLASKQSPVEIEVVALQWKWLFIYPREGLASVNYVQFPVDRPVHFRITADAPMNSFWIPQLGGQIYAMNGMTSELNLQADEAGRYNGSSANISGEGFADMRFIAQATSEAEFSSWAMTVRNGSQALTMDTYKQLAVPASSPGEAMYSLREDKLYDKIIDKYMSHSASHLKGEE